MISRELLECDSCIAERRSETVAAIVMRCAAQTKPPTSQPFSTATTSWSNLAVSLGIFTASSRTMIPLKVSSLALDSMRQRRIGGRRLRLRRPHRQAARSQLCGAGCAISNLASFLIHPASHHGKGCGCVGSSLAPPRLWAGLCGPAHHRLSSRVPGRAVAFCMLVFV